MSLLRRLFGPRHGFGHVPESPDVRDLPFDALGFDRHRLTSTPPSNYSLARFASPLDQGQTQSCVAHAIAQGLVVAHAARDNPIELPSRRYLYWNSRGFHDQELYDLGTFLRTCMRGLVHFGAPAEPFWPWAPELINRSPTWKAHRHAHDQRGLAGYYRIFDDGNARLERIRLALANDRPVAFGTAVDRAFLDFGGGRTVGPPMSVYGRHAMLVVGYEPGRFRVVNSWGRYWGDGGFAWLSDDYLASDDTVDLWALDPER